MSDVGRYGVTQNADGEMITANELVGERVGGTRVDSAIAGASPALFSTAPYAPHGRNHGPLCAKSGCGNYHLKGDDFCRHHTERRRS